MTKPHDFGQDDVMAWLDGELSADRAAAVRAHIDACAACAALADDLRQVSSRLQDWRVDVPLQSMPAAIRNAMAEPARGRWSWLTMPAVLGLPRWSLAAASIAGVVLVAVVVRPTRQVGVTSPPVLRQDATVPSPVDELARNQAPQTAAAEAEAVPRSEAPEQRQGQAGQAGAAPAPARPAGMPELGRATADTAFRGGREIVLPPPPPPAPVAAPPPATPPPPTEPPQQARGAFIDTRRAVTGLTAAGGGAGRGGRGGAGAPANMTVLERSDMAKTLEDAAAGTAMSVRVTLTVADAAAARVAIAALAQSLGGRVGVDVLGAAAARPTGDTTTFVVPRERVRDALDRLASLGAVVADSPSAEHLEAAILATANELAAATETEAGLAAQRARQAAGSRDAAGLDRALQLTRDRIARLTAEELALRDRTTHATITVSLRGGR
jgi:hypothetical protein